MFMAAPETSSPPGSSDVTGSTKTILLAREEGEGRLYRISRRIDRAVATRLYEQDPMAPPKGPKEPRVRALRIYALNPGVSQLAGGLATAKVPYEPLDPGPVGSVLEVSPRGPAGEHWRTADLESHFVLMEQGYAPSLADPCFHQQMVYAVGMITYDNVRQALGRHIAWPFDRVDAQGRNRLLLRPHGALEENAWYDPVAGAIVFGYFKARCSTPVVEAGEGYVFTALSHDIIAHEMSHALLDGLRAHFLEPTHPDVLAFHEAFADLVAFFQHFTFEAVVRSAIGKARGQLERADLLIDIAQEFGRALDAEKTSLRTLAEIEREAAASDPEGPCEPRLLRYEEASRQPHDLGQVLARAVFAAFLAIYNRRARPYIKLATGGTGELPPGDIPRGLEDFLVKEARRLADQILTICIRAIDYCPPVDIRFGDYLRALITADRDVVPDDDLAYRESIIQAFGKRGIYGEGTRSMMEDELAWNPPRVDIPREKALSFAELAFEGDPAKPMGSLEMRRQAGVLGRLVTHRDLAGEFGLVSPEDPEFAAGGYSLPMVESIRSARRIGPDRQVVFDLVAEVIQFHEIPDPDGRLYRFYGGATVIIDALGAVRYIIRKRVDNEKRMATQAAFMQSPAGARFWAAAGDRIRPAPALARMLCANGHAAAVAKAEAEAEAGAGTPAETLSAGETTVLITGPAHLPSGLQVMVDGRFTRIETGIPARLPAGEHSFQINTDDGRYRRQCHCPPGHDDGNPFRIEVDDLVDD
jgi:hypothetical protein